MTASEIITSFCSKSTDGSMGNISQKQYDWLLQVAKKEGLYTDRGHGAFNVVIDKKHWVIKPGRRLASGGSFVGSKPTGRYGIRLHYHIKFKDTGITEFRDSDEVERILKEGIHQFDYI